MSLAAEGVTAVPPRQDQGLTAAAAARAGMLEIPIPTAVALPDSEQEQEQALGARPVQQVALPLPVAQALQAMAEEMAVLAAIQVWRALRVLPTMGRQVVQAVQEPPLEAILQAAVAVAAEQA